MNLYVCWGTWRRPTPVVGKGSPHPCGAAHEALEDAGHEPKVVRALGWKALPDVFNFTPARRNVKKLTGDISVPVLVTDDGEVVAGSREIAAWAEANPA